MDILSRHGAQFCTAMLLADLPLARTQRLAQKFPQRDARDAQAADLEHVSTGKRAGREPGQLSCYARAGAALSETQANAKWGNGMMQGRPG